MNYYMRVFRLVLLVSLFAGGTLWADDLKEYFERKKKEFLPTFKAPQLGSEVTLRLAGGQRRTGILMKLSTSSISLMTDSGMVEYKRLALHESSRAVFFADDHAHAKALGATREHKRQLQVESIQEEQAGLHEGRISVSSKVEKESEKEEEEDERELKSGDTLTTTTITKTETRIQKLKVTVANNTTHPDTYTLEWYFLSEPIIGGKASIHDSGTRRITVDARKRTVVDLASEPFVIEETTVIRENSGYGRQTDPRISESGKKIAGYVVFLKHGSDLLDKKASSSVYLSDEWIGRFRL